RKTLLTMLLAAVLTVTVGVGSASADTLILDIGFTNNGPLGALPGPYGELLIDRTSSTTATFTLTSNTKGGNIYLFGDGNTIGLNVNASGVAVGAITTTLPG